jgi:hypothetical protein
MAILNQILGNGGGGMPFSFQPLPMRPMNFAMPPGVHPPAASEAYGAPPQNHPGMGDNGDGNPRGGGGFFDQVKPLFGHLGGSGPIMAPGAAGGVPGAGGGAAPGGAAASPAGFGGGITGAIMRAFSGGAGGGMDPSKLMALAAMI